MSTMTVPAPFKLASWRTPVVLIAAGCAIALLTFGPRSALGQFLSPMSFAHGWGRDAFSFAIAIQNLLWGAASRSPAGRRPLRAGAGALRRRHPLRDRAGADGLCDLAVTLDLSAGVLIGLGLSGCSFPLVVGALGKLVPESWRSFAFGAGTAAGSFGQFLFSPLARALIDAFSWQTALLVFAGMMLLVLPLSLVLATPPAPRRRRAAQPQSRSRRSPRRSAIAAMCCWCSASSPAASSSPSSPCTCRPICSTAASVPTSAPGPSRFIGLFNIVGSLGSGWLAGRMPKRYLLSIIYFGRAPSDRRLHHAAGEHGIDADFRRGHRPALALDRAADLGPGGADVRHALAHHAVRLRFLQPSGRRLPWRLARRLAVRAHRLL